ncbi:hypothetical protein OH76DRAFT_1490346 [Lentinus brumalis]|uniref:Uncharacterized protein n=1 Tax=Lentinus brumalis TaxID=2498619 RepID=A0A371CJ98_9APHY|nr:hypothetical protein OH76DRAFT_1490346 [Polyporus brumalis]
MAARVTALEPHVPHYHQRAVVGCQRRSTSIDWTYIDPLHWNNCNDWTGWTDWNDWNNWNDWNDWNDWNEPTILDCALDETRSAGTLRHIKDLSAPPRTP